MKAEAIRSFLLLCALALGSFVAPPVAAAQSGQMALQLESGVENGKSTGTVEYPVGQVAPEKAASTSGGKAAYHVDTGDAVTVSVYGEPDLSVQQEKVKGDGTIAMPLLGDVQVRGLTAPQIKSLLEAKLRDGYLKKPNVNVSIDTFRMYYIKGEVKNPGGYHYSEGLTVDQAVALAGGYTPRASEGQITVVRQSAPSKVQKIGPGASIRPGDVITVGESFF